MKFLSTSLIAATFMLSLSQQSFSSELASTGEYAIDSQHSGVFFAVDHLGYTNVIGRFNDFSGKFTIADSSSKLKVIVQSNSVDTNHDKRDDHLRSPDFFNAKQFPTITFSSPLDINAIEGNNEIQGELTMLGISKPITLKIKKGKEGKDPWGLYRVGYKAEGKIKRSDYGMNFMQGGLGDDIHIKMYIEAVKK